MSRGLGIVQRAILWDLYYGGDEGDWASLAHMGMWTDPDVAGNSFADLSEKPVRATWRRAIRTLEQRGLVDTRVADNGALETRITEAGQRFVFENQDSVMAEIEIHLDWAESRMKRRIKSDLGLGRGFPADGSGWNRSRRVHRQRELRRRNQRSDRTAPASPPGS